MSAWKFYLVTFGCKVNQYETQSLREAWLAQGGVECSAPAEADVVCVNSCAITSKGERDARNAVFRLRMEAPSSRLILTGCAARLFADYKPRPGAIWAAPDLLVPQEEKSRLLHGPWADIDGEGVIQSAGMLEATAPAATVAVASPAQAEAKASKQAFPPFQISAFKRARPVLKVQDGCAHRCTYCIVPSTRGKPRSRPVDEIVSEARRLLQAGHAEIMVSGINLGQYGRGTARTASARVHRLAGELRPTRPVGIVLRHRHDRALHCVVREQRRQRVRDQGQPVHHQILLGEFSTEAGTAPGRGHDRPQSAADAVRGHGESPSAGFGGSGRARSSSTTR